MTSPTSRLLLLLPRDPRNPRNLNCDLSRTNTHTHTLRIIPGTGDYDRCTTPNNSSNSLPRLFSKTTTGDQSARNCVPKWRELGPVLESSTCDPRDQKWRGRGCVICGQSRVGVAQVGGFRQTCAEGWRRIGECMGTKLRVLNENRGSRRSDDVQICAGFTRSRRVWVEDGIPGGAIVHVRRLPPRREI